MSPSDGDTAVCANLKDGERMFSKILESEVGYEFIRDLNDTAPKLLQKYFQPTKQKELEERRSLIAEGRQESEQDMKRNPTPSFC